MILALAFVVAIYIAAIVFIAYGGLFLLVLIGGALGIGGLTLKGLKIDIDRPLTKDQTIKASRIMGVLTGIGMFVLCIFCNLVENPEGITSWGALLSYLVVSALVASLAIPVTLLLLDYFALDAKGWEQRERDLKIGDIRKEYEPTLRYLLVNAASSEEWHGPPLPYVSYGHGGKYDIPAPHLCSRKKADLSPYQIEAQLAQWLDRNPGGDRIQVALEWTITDQDEGGYHDWRVWLLLNQEWTPTNFVVAHRANWYGRWDSPPFHGEQEKFTIEACTLSEESLKRGLNKIYSKA